MNLADQIAAVRSALAAIQAQIAQTTAALATASTPDDVQRLTSALANLRAQEAQLQAILANLEAAAAGVQPMGFAATLPATPAITARNAGVIRKLAADLRASIVDREVARVTIERAERVAQATAEMRMLLSGMNPSAASTASGSRPAAKKGVPRGGAGSARTKRLSVTGENPTRVPRKRSPVNT